MKTKMRTEKYCVKEENYSVKNMTNIIKRYQ